LETQTKYIGLKLNRREQEIIAGPNPESRAASKGVLLNDRSPKNLVLMDRVFRYSVWFFTLAAIIPLGFILFSVIKNGIGQINLDFFTKIEPNTYDAMVSVRSGEVIPGGILNGMAGTLLITVMAMVLAIPLGIAAGIYLSSGRQSLFSNLVRNITDILMGVPSIVLGLLSYLWIVIHITRGFSALAGSIALGIMMLPLIIRSTEESLKMLPASLLEAGLSLGAPWYMVQFRILLPAALSGILSGILLAVSRVMGETAPLLFTALGSSAINWDITRPTSAVPLQIYRFYHDPNMVSLVWSASLFLIVIVLLLNIVAKRISYKTRIKR
jgi:phosphate transport system permease protein